MSTHRRLALILSISLLVSLASAIPFLKVGHAGATGVADGSRREALPTKKHETATLVGRSEIDAWKAESLTTPPATRAGDFDEDGLPDTVAAESGPCRLTVQSVVGLFVLALPSCADSSQRETSTRRSLGHSGGRGRRHGVYVTPGDGRGNRATGPDSNSPVASRHWRAARLIDATV